MTKIDIISGFLGAGKTTLIKKLLEEGFQGEKVVLIENEFGEIGIDSGFLKEAGIQITEMNAGCICCSLVGDFSTALKEVLEKFAPDRVIIEPSGVGKLSDVIKAVREIMHEAEITLNSLVAVADGTKCKMYMKNFGEFFNNQIEHANTIILSRTQKMDEKKLEDCVKEIQKHNEKAAVVTTPWEKISGKQILDTMEKKASFAEELLEEAEVCPSCGHAHHHGEHSHEGHECCKHAHEQEADHNHEGHECCKHAHEQETDHHHNEHECTHTHNEHGDCGCGHSHHEEHHCCGADHHHAEDVFTSWGVETPHKYKEEDIKDILLRLSDAEELGMILRAKGIVPSVGEEWLHFDFVPGEYEIRKGEPDYTGRLCVIGTKLDEEKLKEVFHL